MANLEALRLVSRGTYDNRGYSNEETIAALALQQPAQLSNVLTYTYGKDDDRFPLTFLTEGQGSIGVEDIDTVEWTWRTMGRQKFNDYVVYFDTTNTTPGKGGAMFDVEFSNHWIINQYGLIAPDGVTQVRVMQDLGPGPHGGYLYRLALNGVDPDRYVALDNLEVGKYWSMTAPTISESYSKGNRSNVIGPGKMKSQLEFHRYSKEIAGNISNVVLSYEFNTVGGGKKSLWINEEMSQFDVACRIMDEERLWLAEYNRDINGRINLIDPDNGQPIPHTAGMMQICREANYDTYGEVLTLNKIKRSIGDLFTKDSDFGAMEITIFGGKGFLEDFHECITNDVKREGFITPLGEKMIEDNGKYLSYGRYFNRYKTVDGHIITVQPLSFLDNGTIADNAKANGMIHPNSGLPITSHQGFVIDMSQYNGQRNVKKMRQKGQIYNAGVLKGLTPIPASWGAVPGNSIATDVDKSSWEVKNSYGLQVYNSTKMMMLKCEL